MFLSKDSKSPFYQITYFVEGKRTKKSTKTTDLNEARKFLASFSIPVKINNVVYEANNSILLEDFKMNMLALPNSQNQNTMLPARLNPLSNSSFNIAEIFFSPKSPLAT
ncbi:MAG: hypothetical protein IPH11_19590 [Ignavibacteriales bacterium]|nr:hypothetical protein [Ignavibacteriales bacterium]